VEIDKSFLDLAWYFAVGAGILLFLLIGLWLVRGFLAAGGATFLKSRNRRLGVVDQAPVDGRRRLLLLRRDGVEHLVMTGGPIDIVIETGIGAPERPESDRLEHHDPGPPTPLDDGRIRIAASETENA
jgi:hypothetical protein